MKDWLVKWTKSKSSLSDTEIVWAPVCWYKKKKNRKLEQKRIQNIPTLFSEVKKTLNDWTWVQEDERRRRNLIDNCKWKRRRRRLLRHESGVEKLAKRSKEFELKVGKLEFVTFCVLHWKMPLSDVSNRKIFYLPIFGWMFYTDLYARF